MKLGVRLALFILFPWILGSLPCHGQSENAKAELQAGILAFKGARFEGATIHFRHAVDLDPEYVQARLYLATSYAQQYIPGVDEAANTRLAKVALQEYNEVLQRDPNTVEAVKGSAYLLMQMKQFENAKEFYHKAIELDPRDPESYYSIAVIDWTEAYQPRMELRARLKLRPAAALIGASECETMRVANESRVEEGIQMLTEALSLRPDYNDAMAYMNLLYRERADIQCGDPEAYRHDLETADKWVDVTIGVKKKKAESAAGAPDQ